MCYEDLTECDYFSYDKRLRGTVAVGWLDRSKLFPVGKTSKTIYKKLCKLVVKAELWRISHFLGYHECNICQFHGFQNNGEICIPHKNKIFVAPLAIVHYINAHQYQPPKEFCEAVMQCPSFGSQNYQKKMIENGGEKILSVMRANHNKVMKWIKTGEVTYFHMQSYESYNRTN